MFPTHYTNFGLTLHSGFTHLYINKFMKLNPYKCVDINQKSSMGHSILKLNSNKKRTDEKD